MVKISMGLRSAGNGLQAQQQQIQRGVCIARMAQLQTLLCSIELH
jgi:hypothetical protein